MDPKERGPADWLDAFECALLALLITGLTAFLLSACGGLRIIEDPSRMALTAGDMAMLVGGCEKPLVKGYENCQIRRGGTLPVLSLHFLNPAQYAISDCLTQIYKRGKIDAAGTVSLDLAGITEQARRFGFCLIRVEAVEYYPDPRDPSQVRTIPMAGGFFIEVLDDDYIPEPTRALTSWCYIIRGTNKGRRSMQECVP